MATSRLEQELAFQMNALNLPSPEVEYRFHPTRRWRVDFAWPSLRIACEVEGGTWAGGRHTRGTGFEKDCEKYNALALQGWRLFRVTGKMIKDGRAIDTLAHALWSLEAG